MTLEGRLPALPAGGGGGRRRGLEAHGPEAGRQGPRRDGLATWRGPQDRRDPEGGKKSSVSIKQRGKEGVSCLRSSRCFERAERLRGPLQARRATRERGSPALEQQMQMRAEPAPSGRSPSPAQAPDPFEAGPPPSPGGRPADRAVCWRSTDPLRLAIQPVSPGLPRSVIGFRRYSRRVVHPLPRARGRAAATAPFGSRGSRPGPPRSCRPALRLRLWRPSSRR